MENESQKKSFKKIDEIMELKSSKTCLKALHQCLAKDIRRQTCIPAQNSISYILKCFTLIDLKNSKIIHQDVGQMDMYIRMYDEFKKSEDDNPTLGIILCSDTDEDDLRAEIENPKTMFLIQINERYSLNNSFLSVL